MVATAIQMSWHVDYLIGAKYLTIKYTEWVNGMNLTFFVESPWRYQSANTHTQFIWSNIMTTIKYVLKLDVVTIQGQPLFVEGIY